MGLKIIYGWKGLSFRIINLKMESIQCNENDVKNGYVNPEAVLDVKQTMFSLLRTGINGEINRKVVTLEFSGIQAVVTGKILSEEAIFDLTLDPVEQNAEPSSKIKIQLSS